MKFPRPLPFFLLLASLSATWAEDAAKTDPRYPFQTDFANANLPWYQPKPGEFPPHHSDRRIGGELVSCDYIHRTGTFRSTKTGELVDFTIPPYGSVNYLNTDADLRDVPLGTFFLFFLNQDTQGNFTRLATMQDQFTMDAGHSFSYRLDEIHAAENKLLTTKQSLSKNQLDLGKKELVLTPQTHLWKAGKPIAVADLAPGDELLFNFTGKTAIDPGVCTDIWVGADEHQRVTEEERKKFDEFNRKRGLAGWIDKTEANDITITLFSGDAPGFKKLYLADLAVGKDAALVVSNDELRTYNPPVDKEKCNITELKNVPVEAYGCSGVQIRVQVSYMLEGFRRNRSIRLFLSGWNIKDPPYGESLMGYGYSQQRDPEVVEQVAKEYPRQFPYRTDFGNEKLPWYKLEPDKIPPQFSEHRLIGELIKADAENKSAEFHLDRTGEIVKVELNSGATVRYRNADAKLGDIPAGTRCWLNLFQDQSGTFTKAQLVADDISHSATNLSTNRAEALHLDQNHLQVAWQMDKMKNYNGDMEQPGDIGHETLLVTPETRVWKDGQPAKLTDLAAGDALLVNRSADWAGHPSTCTEIWIGSDAHRLITEKQKLAENK